MILYIGLIFFFLIVALWVFGFLFCNDFSVRKINGFNNIKEVLVVFPHPDDEVMMCGGVISKFSGQGIKVNMLILTKGERGNPDCHLDTNLKIIRTREAIKAAGILGVLRITHLDLGDNRLAGNKKSAEKTIKKEISKISPDLIITYDLSGLYGHDDHIIVSEIVTKLAEKNKIRLWYASYPKQILNMINLPEHMSKKKNLEKLREAPNLRVFTGFNVLRKIKAVYAYKSQYPSFKDAYPINLIPLWFYVSMSLIEYFHEVEQN